MSQTEGLFPVVIVRLQKTFPLRVTEWALALILFNWGVILSLHPGAFWARPYFSNLQAIAPQGWWAAVCLGLGIARLAALAVNGAWMPTPFIRAVTAFLTCWIWMQISFGLSRNELPSLGLATYPVFLLLDVYNVYRASADARVAYDYSRRGVSLHA